MAIYAIADLHLDSKKEKPMDIFGEQWKNHEETIFENWENQVSDEDLVLLPGDISWAMHLKDAEKDLKKIEKLPGYKVMIKGNHDYWWNSLSKLNQLELKTIFFLQNNSYVHESIGICGTRAWFMEAENAAKEDEKIFKRELMRLDLSLKSLPKVSTKIAILHYPPFRYDGKDTPFVEKMKEEKVDICLYGHLHGDGHKFVKEGIIGGIQYICVAADYLNFSLRKIM